MPEIEFAGQDDVKPVTIRDRILWGGGTLLSLPKEQGPIPLYSYPISQLPEDTTLDALALAAKGKVYIAIVTFNDSEQKSGAEARGLKVPADWNSISNKEWKKEKWENFQTEHFADKDNVRIAFTRPLALKKSIV